MYRTEHVQFLSMLVRHSQSQSIIIRRQVLHQAQPRRQSILLRKPRILRKVNSPSCQPSTRPQLPQETVKTGPLTLRELKTIGNHPSQLIAVVCFRGILELRDQNRMTLVEHRCSELFLARAIAHVHHSNDCSADAPDVGFGVQRRPLGAVVLLELLGSKKALCSAACIVPSSIGTLEQDLVAEVA